MQEAMARYVVRHCGASALTKASAWDLGKVWPKRLVSAAMNTLAEAPLTMEPLTIYKKPSMVFFAACPCVETRQKAGSWAKATRQQTGWTSYAFGQDFLFPKERTIVLLSPEPTGEAKGAYAAHASMLAPSPPLVFLSSNHISEAADLLKGKVLEDSEDSVDAEAASDAASNLAQTLRVGDGFAAFYVSEMPPMLAVFGPRHDEARKVYQKALENLSDLFEEDETEESILPPVSDANKASFILSNALTREEISLLDTHELFLVPNPPTALYPLSISPS